MFRSSVCVFRAVCKIIQQHLVKPLKPCVILYRKWLPLLTVFSNNPGCLMHYVWSESHGSVMVSLEEDSWQSRKVTETFGSLSKWFLFLRWEHSVEVNFVAGKVKVLKVKCIELLKLRESLIFYRCDNLWNGTINCYESNLTALKNVLQLPHPSAILFNPLHFFMRTNESESFKAGVSYPWPAGQKWLESWRFVARGKIQILNKEWPSRRFCILLPQAYNG